MYNGRLHSFFAQGGERGEDNGKFREGVKITLENQGEGVKKPTELQSEFACKQMYSQSKESTK
jgi:hypothetical protein